MSAYIVMKSKESLKYKLKHGMKRLFKSANLYIRKGDDTVEYPCYLKLVVNDEGTFVYYDLPKGLGVGDFIKKQQSIEMYLGFSVDIDREDDLLRIRLRSIDVPDKVTYDIHLVRSYIKQKGYTIPVILGVDGENIIGFDISERPAHLSIGGTTGGGKSNLLRVIITTIATTNSPKLVQMAFIDHKEGVEAMLYEGLPHMKAISVNTDQTLALLTSLVSSMKKRYNFIKENRCVSISSYNKFSFRKLSHIIVIVDEMGDLNPEETSKEYHRKGEPLTEREKRMEIQSLLSQIARKGRAAGVHLITATQRPDGFVMPKQIQQNMSARIAYHCDEEYSSEAILGINNYDACKIPADKPGRAIFRFEGTKDVQTFFLDEFEAEDILLKYAGLQLDRDSIVNRNVDVDDLNDVFKLKL